MAVTARQLKEGQLTTTESPKTNGTTRKGFKATDADKANTGTVANPTPVSAKAAPPQERIEVKPLHKVHLRVPVIGTAPLIVSKFSEKARKQMLDAQQGVKTPKANRKPEDEFVAASYKFSDGGYGMPTTAFKECLVGAARYYGRSVTMKELRQIVFIRGEFSDVEQQSLIRIVNDREDGMHANGEDEWPRNREDVVRLAGPSRAADLRFRPEFSPWSATLDIIFVESSISPEAVVNMLDAGGEGIGVGEWRPERRGEFGTFMIDSAREVQVVEPGA